MKKSIYPFLFLTIVISAFASLSSQEWQIKEGFTVKFSSKNPSGFFNDLKGTIRFDEQSIDLSEFDVTIEVESINTGNNLKNKHALSDDYFDAKKYPLIHFTSKEITKTEKGFKVVGDIDMHGIKKEIIIPFTFERSGSEGLFKGNFEINRTDFNIGKPGGKIPEVLAVEVSVPVIGK